MQPENDEMGNIAFDEATKNHGPGKYLPEGPTFIYNGKTITCATYAGESGGIRADFLVAVLTVLDEFDVFPHDSGVDQKGGTEKISQLVGNVCDYREGYKEVGGGRERGQNLDADTVRFI